MTTTPTTSTSDTSTSTSTARTTAVSRRAVVAVLFAATLILGACGNEVTKGTSATNSTTAPSTRAVGDTGGEAAPIAVRETALGDLLVGKDGMTLYGFTNDVDAVSTCEGVCAEAWPPVTVSANWTPGPGLDSGIFATAPRSDGTLQLVAGKWPLYYYSGDVAAGDVSGQGSGDVWFVVGADGKLVTDPAPEGGASAARSAEADEGAAPVGETKTDLGTVLTDAEGLTLYGFTKDTDGTPTCEGGCADAWPALTVDGDELPEGLDPKVFSVVDRPDGSKQLKAGKWPLYRFSGDAAVGDTNGQGSGGVWFAVATDGSLVKGEAPAAPADSSRDGSPSDDDGGY